MNTIAPALTDKGYCHASEAGGIRIGNRDYSVGFGFNSRVVYMGPIVEGWHGFMNQAPVVLSAHYEAPRPKIHAEIGDTVEGPDGTLWTIAVTPGATDRNSDYLTLVEVSA